jgi:Heterokaryon incompatibility protein (HET)
LGTSSRALYNLPRSLDDQINFDVLRGWLQNCSGNHNNACTLSPAQVDDANFQKRQRLIDVRSRWIVPADFARTKYAALTYVWGKFSYLTSNRSNTVSNDCNPRQGSHQSGAIRPLPDILPQAFEDAITVCKELGLAYLWIDMCCIDHEDEEDKKTQVRHMDGVCGGAYLTIVAIEGADPTAGLPRVRALDKNPALSTTEQGLPTEIRSGYHLAVVPGFSIPKTVWITRAWTLQEALLSKRLVVFNERHVSFYCRSGTMREDIAHSNGDDANKFDNWLGVSRLSAMNTICLNSAWKGTAL